MQSRVETTRSFQPESTVAIVEQGDKAELFALLLYRNRAEDERQLLQQGGCVIRQREVFSPRERGFRIKGLERKGFGDA